MKKNVIVDNEELLLMEDKDIGYLFVNKNKGGWSVIFYGEEEDMGMWLDMLKGFNRGTREKVQKTKIFNFIKTKKEKEMLDALNREISVTYNAEISLNGRLLATTSDFFELDELENIINNTMKLSKDLVVNIYRTVSLFEPLEAHETIGTFFMYQL